MKYIVVTEASKDDWAYNEWKRNGIVCDILFKRVGKLARAIRRLHIKSNIPYKSFWLGKWKKQLDSLDVIVLHVSSLTMWIPKYINTINPKVRVIAWYWNSVTSDTNPINLKGECEIWSFDPENCKEYGMKFNHQYYFKSLIKNDVTIDKDLFFCGSDSGRGERITNIYTELKKRGVNADFRIVNPQYQGIPDEIKSERMKYADISINICSSKAILELVRKGQSGATARLMEAVFQGKKLITDNKHVVDEPFYDESRIFLLDDNKWDDIVAFLNTPSKEYGDEIIDEYDVVRWISRFGIDI